jgi:hypothetical protein
MGPPPPIITPLAPKAKPPAPVVVVVKAPPPVKPVVPAVPYDNTPKTAPWWSADGVTARETKPAWWSTPQGSGAEAAAKPTEGSDQGVAAERLSARPAASPPTASPTQPTDGVEQSDGSFVYKF